MTYTTTNNGTLSIAFERQTRLDHAGFRVWLSLIPTIDTSLAPDIDTKANPIHIYNLEDGVTYYFKVGTYTRFHTAWNDCVFSDVCSATITNEAQHRAEILSLL